MTERELEALAGAMFRLRMNLAGHSSYSGTPSKIDHGWALMVAEGLDLYGCEVVTKSGDHLSKPEQD